MTLHSPTPMTSSARTNSRNLLRSFCVVVLAGMLTGCYALSTSPVTGFLYTDLKGPMTATGENASRKVGQAKCSTILGLIATGDCSIQAAMRAGGISNVHHVDYESSSVLGITASYTTTVYGD